MQRPFPGAQAHLQGGMPAPTSSAHLAPYPSGSLGAMAAGLGNLPQAYGPAPWGTRIMPGSPYGGGSAVLPKDPSELAREQAQQGGGTRLMDLRLEDLEAFLREAVFWNQPSPLVQPPYRGYYAEKTQLAVVAPPTATAAAAATAGVAGFVAGAAQWGTTPITVTPASVSVYADLLTFTLPADQAYLIYAVEAWGHDWAGSLQALLWRVTNAGSVVLDNRELGVMNPLAKIQSVVKPQGEVKVQVRNLDPNSATMVWFRMQGWVFPLPNNNEDDLWSLVKQGLYARG